MLFSERRHFTLHLQSPNVESNETLGKMQAVSRQTLKSVTF